MWQVVSKCLAKNTDFNTLNMIRTSLNSGDLKKRFWLKKFYINCYANGFKRINPSHCEVERDSSHIGI